MAVKNYVKEGYMAIITKAVRLHGAGHARLEVFPLPHITEYEILVKVVSDGLCMSSYKLFQQGKAHKRCPKTVDSKPIILGHELSGVIVQVGRHWQLAFTEGQKFALQPAIQMAGQTSGQIVGQIAGEKANSFASPGYSYEFCGGAATYAIIPREFIEAGHFMVYEGAGYFPASLAEPLSCVIRSFKSMFHAGKDLDAPHMGVVCGGNMLILGGAGPLGLGAEAYALHGSAKPARLVVVDVDEARLARAQRYFPPALAKQQGVDLHYVLATPSAYPLKNLHSLALFSTLEKLSLGQGYDDIFVYAAAEGLAELGDALLARDGCMNFFAGPSSKDFTAELNMYQGHYKGSRLVFSSGGTAKDMQEALHFMEQSTIPVAGIVSHICGLGAVPEALATLPSVRAGKILSYNHVDIPLIALEDFAILGETQPLFAKLHASVMAHGGLWNTEAEEILLSHFTG